MTLTRTFPTDRAAGLPLADTRLLVAAMVESDTTGKPRAGVLPSHYNPLVTGTTGMAYSVAAFAAVTARAGMGAELVANDGAATVATTAAPGANSRIDVIWVRSLFTTYADGSSDPVFGVTQGVAAASPSKPAIPAGALELATAVVLSTTTQTVTAVITQTHPYTAMEGGVVPVRTMAELTAWTTAIDGQLAFVRATGALYVYLATAPTPGWFHDSGIPADGGAVTITAGGAGFVAGTPVPRLRYQGGRYYLEGNFGNNISAAFGAGLAYSVGSIPSAAAPAADRRVPISTNGPMAVSLIIAATGALSLVTHQAFTGTAIYSLDGASWADKRFG